MGKVVFDISMSLDGFMTAANRRPEEPMGDGGERLHEWAFGGDPRDREVLTGGVASIGAVIAGRRTYDDSVPWWGADGPTGPARVPVFVISHDVPEKTPEGGVYTFVTGGIERALEQAKATAGEKGVTVMGGADTGQQYLRAGLLDELSIHLIPVLFGSGTRMFDHLDDKHVELEPGETIQTPAATHLRYRVVRKTDA
ncbi:MAG TPA: dihydrofolate reductase family protein [Actinomycetes bacterium]|nr:dihydrofolate reductase family protein [Actinomycetes bacterium]